MRPMHADLSSTLVSRFHSKQDLIDALLTSCHIPLYFNGTLTRSFRGGAAMDGGIINFLPVPPAAAYTARICCFPSKNFTLVRPRSSQTGRHPTAASWRTLCPEPCCCYECHRPHGAQHAHQDHPDAVDAEMRSVMCFKVNIV